MIVAFRRFEQLVAHRHRRRRDRAARAWSRDPDAAPRIQRSKRAHAEWPTSAARSTPQASSSATSQSRDRARPTQAARRRERPCPGRSTASTLRPMMREVARLQRPHAVVVRRAVHEHDRRQRRHRRRASRCSHSMSPARRSLTRIGQRASAPCPRRTARGSGPRCRSSASSSPTDSRIVPSVMPARDAGRRRTCGNAWSTPDGSPATWRRRRWRGARKDPQRLDELAPLRARAARG